MENFSVVTTYTYAHEYAILKLILDKEAIRYIFENETMINISPFYSNAIGGIKLKVHNDDLDVVKKIIHKFDSEKKLRIV